MSEYHSNFWIPEMDLDEITIKPKHDPFKTENILNRDKWVDGDGTVHELNVMGRDYLQNVLHFLYKNRNRFWLNCKDVSIVEKFIDGDEFFQLVIRKSTIWTSIVDELEQPSDGFNFDFDKPGYKK